MSSKTEPKETITPSEVVPANEDAGSYLASFEPDKTQKPYPLSEITKAMGLTGPRIPAGNLIDQPFAIMRANPFGSTLDPQRHAYFCVCVDQTTGEVFTTVLGGWAVVDILDAVFSAGIGSPLLVTLRWVEGGRYGRYYVLE